MLGSSEHANELSGFVKAVYFLTIYMTSSFLIRPVRMELFDSFFIFTLINRNKCKIVCSVSSKRFCLILHEV